ncbi:MAG: DUF924 domain-containing protein [Burkholderiaceae bacterium]|nr:DUF924 domain-containing protein [Burkholderiaceae bacterium]
MRAFWFLPDTGAGTAAGFRPEWFRKDPAFDESIRARFGPLVERALTLPAGAPPAWGAAPDDVLAEILVLDQFPRNLYRGQPRAFAGDARALALALALIARGDDRRLRPLERLFAYLPLEHAEDLALQDRSVDLFSALAAGHEGFGEVLDYAERHRDVIRRFGRFPHRNAALGRASTPAEVEYLAQPGSGF